MMFPENGFKLENCFFATQNEDGSYSDPIPGEGVKEITFSYPEPDYYIFAWWLLFLKGEQDEEEDL